MELKDLNTEARPTWCPGCGNYGIWNALKRALVTVGTPPERTLIVGGVGCSGKSPYWVKTYGFHGLHGRGVPVATGAKLANADLQVLCIAGDGDQYDEGLNHLIHAARRNINITLLVHNNQVFGLTKGQTSPTADVGFKSKTSPWGVRERPVNPLAIALSAHATFVARCFAADLAHTAATLAAAVKHEGFAIVDILQPCVTFNHVNTFDWYRQRVYKIGPELEGKANHDPSDRMAAFARTQEWGERIPIGIIYKEQRDTFDGAMPQLKQGPLVNKNLNVDIAPLVKKFY